MGKPRNDNSPGTGRAPRQKDGRFLPNPDTLDRDAQAFNMRSRGCTYSEIAIALEFTDGGHVAKALRRHVQRRIAPDIDEHRARADEELDAMQRAVLRVLETTHYKVADGRVVYFDGPEGDGPAQPLKDDSPILASVDRWLKIQDRRAKLFGLDAATKVETSGSVTVRVEGAEDV
jgi:hypothetical protein